MDVEADKTLVHGRRTEAARDDHSEQQDTVNMSTLTHGRGRSPAPEKATDRGNVATTTEDPLAESAQDVEHPAPERASTFFKSMQISLHEPVGSMSLSPGACFGSVRSYT